MEKFVKENGTAVLATVDGEQPNTSTIFYVYKKGSIEFITKTETAKFNNLRKNSLAAITITSVDNQITVNMTGSVVQINNSSEYDEIVKEISKLSYEKLKDLAPIVKLKKGSFAAFKFIPKEGKMMDYSLPSNKITEYKQEF